MERESNVSPASLEWSRRDRMRISCANVREIVRAVQVDVRVTVLIILPDQDAYGRTDGADRR